MPLVREVMVMEACSCLARDCSKVSMLARSAASSKQSPHSLKTQDGRAIDAELMVTLCSLSAEALSSEIIS